VRIFTFTIFISRLSSSPSSISESESPYEGRLSESAEEINNYKISNAKPNVSALADCHVMENNNKINYTEVKYGYALD
jgi:hypothetical protein